MLVLTGNENHNQEPSGTVTSAGSFALAFTGARRGSYRVSLSSLARLSALKSDSRLGR